MLAKKLPESVKMKMVGLLASLVSMDPECAYGVMAGDVKGIAPIDHKAYLGIIEARRLKSQKKS